MIFFCQRFLAFLKSMPGILSQVVFVCKRQSPREKSPELMLTLSESWCLYLFLFPRILGLESSRPPPQFHKEDPKSCCSRGRSLRPGKVLAWVGLLRGLEVLEDHCQQSQPLKIKRQGRQKGGEWKQVHPSTRLAIYLITQFSDKQLLLLISSTNTLLINIFSPTCYINIDVWLNTAISQLL